MNYKGILKSLSKSATKYSSKFTEKEFWIKIFRYAKKAGLKVAYFAIVLFYTMIDQDTPSSSKLIIMGALGYFILPVDLIPDIIPGIGFTDDLAALTGAVVNVAMHIKQEHKEQADKQMTKIFGNIYKSEEMELE